MYIEVMEDIEEMINRSKKIGYLTESESKRFHALLSAICPNDPTPELVDKLWIALTPTVGGADGCEELGDESFSNRRAAISFSGKIRGAILDMKLHIKFRPVNTKMGVNLWKQSSQTKTSFWQSTPVRG